MLFQGMVGIAPSRVLCVPVMGCATHESSVADACGHCDSGSAWCETPAGDDRDHAVALLADLNHVEESCGCFVHIPIPGERQSPDRTHEGEKIQHLRWVASAISGLPISPPEPVRVFARNSEYAPPECSVRDQVMSIRTTRLLI